MIKAGRFAPALSLPFIREENRYNINGKARYWNAENSLLCIWIMAGYGLLVIPASIVNLAMEAIVMQSLGIKF